MKQSLRLILITLLLGGWNVTAEGQTRTLNQCGKDDSVTAIQFTSDGRHLIAACLYDKLVMWDWQAGKKVWEYSFEHKQSEKDYWVTKIYHMVLSPDGNTVALVREHFRVVNNTLKEEEEQVALVNTSNRQEQQIISNSKDLLPSIAFSPDSHLLAWGGNDSSVHFWNVKAKTLLPSLELPRSVLSLAFSPDSKLLAVGLNWSSFSPNRVLGGGSEGLLVFKIQDRERVKGAAFGTRPIQDLTFSPDGKNLVAAPMDMPAEILAWNVSSWERSAILKDAGVPADEVIFSRDGHLLASRFGIVNRGVVFMWRLGTVAKPKAYSIGEGVWSISFSPDGDWLAIGTENGRILLRRVAAYLMKP
jgi:WD40 repeat protein